MAQSEERMIAACGLDCTDCSLRKVRSDAVAADSVVAWFRRRGWLNADEGVVELLARHMACQGCLGDRAEHWSADCGILHCCVDEKGLISCSACDQFVCQRLMDWSAKDGRYKEALARLTDMRAARDA